MNSLENLKNELLLQKQAIESLGGKVIVANLNPSPAEITAGIRTIPATAVATASLTNSYASKLDNQITLEEEQFNETQNELETEQQISNQAVEQFNTNSNQNLAEVEQLNQDSL